MPSKLCPAILLVLSATSAAAHVPPPPLPPGYRDLSAELTNAFNRSDIATYEKLLAEDLQVFDGERLVASSRGKWLEIIKTLVGPNTAIQPMGTVLDSDGSLYAMEQLTLRAAWWGRVIKYDVKGGRITRIRFLAGYGGGLPLLRPDSSQLEPSWCKLGGRC